MNSSLRTIWRASKWGAFAAITSVVILATFAAIKGLLFGWHPSATIYGQADPGFEAAVTSACFMTVFAAIPLSPVAFIGGCIASHFWRADRKMPPIGE